MQVLREGTEAYKFDPARNLGLSRFENQAGDFIFCAGVFDFGILPKLTKPVVYLELEEPNRFFAERGSYNHVKYEDDFDKIFTICPYTAEWLNKKYGNQKRVPVFFPFNEEHVPAPAEKEFDVIYTGHIVSSKILDIIGGIRPFNYRFISNSEHPWVTDRNKDYFGKLDMVARTKISVVANLLYPTWRHALNLWRFKGFETSEAFKFMPRRGDIKGLFNLGDVEVPQIKSRVFEAAFCRSLILCRRDKFNLIENFFEPDKEFVYYEEGKLTETIKNILVNFARYEAIIQNAYDRAISEYTTAKFFEKYLKTLKI